MNKSDFRARIRLLMEHVLKQEIGMTFSDYVNSVIMKEVPLHVNTLFDKEQVEEKIRKTVAEVVQHELSRLHDTNEYTNQIWKAVGLDIDGIIDKMIQQHAEAIVVLVNERIDNVVTQELNKRMKEIET